MKAHVKKGDNVMVIAGKDKGKKGKVLRVVPSTGRVVVEGVNMIKKHQRPNQKVMQGGIIDKEAPLALSNVQVICSKCGDPVRTGKKELEDGKMVRVCAKCGEVLDR
jgi:large subunit ribosomal protein L24